VSLFGPTSGTSGPGEDGRQAARSPAPAPRRRRRLDQSELDGPSELPGWSRLTIVCHLRYGTRELLRMTRDALAGRETAYYPRGRASQRPATLLPSPAEPAAVLDDWSSAARELDDEWSAVTGDRWRTPVVEPADNPDLGTVPLARLALARLTEVEVHGTDLGIGAADWSRTLVAVGLPTRLAWLSRRRRNHRPVDGSIAGSWLSRRRMGCAGSSASTATT
jgi:maleylpyruvate isomerase